MEEKEIVNLLSSLTFEELKSHSHRLEDRNKNISSMLDFLQKENSDLISKRDTLKIHVEDLLELLSRVNSVSLEKASKAHAKKFAESAISSMDSKIKDYSSKIEKVLTTFSSKTEC